MGNLQIYKDFFVCVDCAIFIANGDLPCDASVERETEIISGVENELPSRWVIEASEDGDSDGFMRSSCDCCGSLLAGDRHAASLVQG